MKNNYVKAIAVVALIVAAAFFVLPYSLQKSYKSTHRAKEGCSHTKSVKLSEPLSAKILYIVSATIGGLAIICFYPKYSKYAWITIMATSVLILGFMLKDVSPLSELPGLVDSLVHATFRRGVALIMFVTFAITLLFGRIICGWICPVGAIQSLIASLNKWKRLEVPERYDKALKKLKYAALAGVIATTVIVGKDYANVGEFFNALFNLDLSYYFAAGAVFVVLSLVVERFWCRYLCPLGALLAILQKISILKLRVLEDKCTNCKECLKECPMQCTRVGENDHILCEKCLSKCPLKIIKYST